MRKIESSKNATYPILFVTDRESLINLSVERVLLRAEQVMLDLKVRSISGSLFARNQIYLTAEHRMTHLVGDLKRVFDSCNFVVVHHFDR